MDLPVQIGGEEAEGKRFAGLPKRPGHVPELPRKYVAPLKTLLTLLA